MAHAVLDLMSQHTRRSGTITNVLAKHMRRYCRISDLQHPILIYSLVFPTGC